LRLFVGFSIESDGDTLPVTWQAERIEALPVAADRAPLAIDLSASDPVATQANLHPERDSLELAGVRFELPFGALAVQVLHELLSFDAPGHGAEIRALIGCSSLTEWLASESYGADGTCDEQCMQTACDHAVTRLVSGAESALTALDEARPMIVLSGELALVDDDGDLVAEHMSADELTGEWEPAADETSGDALFGPATASTLVPAAAQR
jgi:hypothetical protein